MVKDRLETSILEFSIFLEQAQFLLSDSERNSLEAVGEAYLKARGEKGVFLPEQLLDLWEDSIDAVPGAREAFNKKYEIANGLWETRNIKGRVIQ